MARCTLDCDAVLFDLDGVLVDSTESIRRVLIEWSSAHGIDPDALLRASHGRRFVDSLRLVAPYLDPDIEGGLLESMEVSAATGVIPIPGAQQLLSSLTDDQWAVVTSASSAVALARMRQAGLPTPPLLVSADHVTKGKPDPEGYRSAAIALGVEPDGCLVVEDAPVGIEAGHRAGMRVIALTSTHDMFDLWTPWVVGDLTSITSKRGIQKRVPHG